MCHCNQCGSDWEPNARSGGNPVQCPRCKRVDWREPRKGVKNDELRGAGSVSAGASVGSGNGAGVPVLPKTKSKKDGLHSLRTVRSELACGGDAPAKLPERGPASIAPKSCPHGEFNAAYCRAKGGPC